jgi:hypothetical protein
MRRRQPDLTEELTALALGVVLALVALIFH